MIKEVPKSSRAGPAGLRDRVTGAELGIWGVGRLLVNDSGIQDQAPEEQPSGRAMGSWIIL